ncbi:hypothetical protein LTR47_003036 [Exophiala xenobiotica]|nr:hypothetical protein LTR47_003036 [Exophiala xenobiotica]KAK5252918.1 hypothetical protein LTS06_002630 [Exophiala xenobiotica]KAK5281785.1 hypothetical protein LTR40_004281 [Exophiala xenobiotica]KAK5327399.1 hypothetical protein LTR93_002783 [Exophiala xenobiotica]KAK5353795.1 hypothetical protein LTR61_002489 [Exophiala xenobiotica]
MNTKDHRLLDDLVAKPASKRSAKDSAYFTGDPTKYWKAHDFCLSTLLRIFVVNKDVLDYGYNIGPFPHDLPQERWHNLWNTIQWGRTKDIPPRQWPGHCCKLDSDEGATIFYIRTYAFTLNECLDIIQAMFYEGLEAQDTPYILWELVRDLDPGDTDDSEQVIFIRCCGTTSFYSAWGRHTNDLRLKYATSISTFLTICERLHPHVIAAAEIDKLPDATVFGKLQAAQRHVVDLREQAPIAPIGPSTLLNSAKGGLSTKFVVQEVETAGTSRLDTKLQQQLQWYTNGSHSATAIHSYATTVQKYANSNSGTVDEAQYQVQGGLPVSP